MSYPFDQLQDEAFYLGLREAELIDVHLLDELCHVYVAVFEN